MKVPWTIFRDILAKAVSLAYSLWPRHQSYFWHRMSVFAFDGSIYTLPATKKIREEFDPQSGFQHKGKGHYPHCLISTAYDVFRRLPVARSVDSIHSSEREQAQALLSAIPSGNVLLFDRGYPSYGFINHLRENYKGYFLFRCPGKSTFPAVDAFINSTREEDFIIINPSCDYLRRLRGKQRKEAKLIQLRIIKLVSPDGTVSVLLTNLLNQKSFPMAEIVKLYFRRWTIEDHYRSEKITLEVEKFHGKTPNSIRQELFAVAIMSVIARTLMMLATQEGNSFKVEYQFKNAVMTLAAEAAILAPHDPQKAVVIFSDILNAISRVKYYRSKSPRPSQPRVTKRPPNRWCEERRGKLANA